MAGIFFLLIFFFFPFDGWVRVGDWFSDLALGFCFLVLGMELNNIEQRRNKINTSVDSVNLFSL